MSQLASTEDYPRGTFAEGFYRRGQLGQRQPCRADAQMLGHSFALVDSRLRFSSHVRQGGNAQTSVPL